MNAPLGQTVERRFEHVHGKLVVQSKRALILEFSRRERRSRLDYQPLFGKMSTHSSPERAAGRVRFPLLV